MNTETRPTEENTQLDNPVEQEESIPEKTKKHPLTLPLLLCIPILCMLAAYMAGVFYYQSHFVNGTIINEMDVSKMTISDLESQIQGYTLKVVQRQADGTSLEEEISGQDIGLSYSSTESLQEILRTQNNWLWFLNQGQTHEIESFVSYDADSLETVIDDLRGFDKDFVTPPEDAYITDYDPEHEFEIVEERQGNQLNRKMTQDAIHSAVEDLAQAVDLNECGCYEEPGITAESEELKNTFAKLQGYAGTTITYTFGSQKEILDGSTISSWLDIDGSQVTLDQTKVEEYVSSLRKKYDTIFHPRTFQTSYGTEITIKNGDYGWWMDTEQETIELTEMIERGESGERTPVYRQTAASYDTPDYGDTYVEINLTAQHLFLYKDGQKVLESDFVSGSVIRGYSTPGGIYALTYKQRDATLTGETYRTPVSFWMPFNNNIGMHDATWRREFGGNIYITSGSHGCINLPYSAAKEIYGYIEKGTPVICYYLPGTESVPEVMLPEDPNNPAAAQAQEEMVPETVPQETAPPVPQETVPQDAIPAETAPQEPAPETLSQE